MYYIPNWELASKMKVENKVAFITGAAQGLGKAFAEELLAHGAKVRT